MREKKDAIMRDIANVQSSASFSNFGVSAFHSISDHANPGSGSTTTDSDGRATASAATGIGSSPVAAGIGSASTGIGSASTGIGSSSTGIGSASTGIGSSSTGIGSASIGIGSSSVAAGIGSSSVATGIGSASATFAAASAASQNDSVRNVIREQFKPLEVSTIKRQHRVLPPISAPLEMDGEAGTQHAGRTYRLQEMYYLKRVNLV
jgi:hypothetical protein